jgi:perosamine synthetase
MSVTEQIFKAIKSVTGNGNFALHEPNFEGNELDYLETCINTTMVSYLGPFVDRFEQELAKATQADYCFSTNSGTSALHLALLAIGIQPNDEVLVPALSFVAPANTIRYCQAIPHFTDINAQTLGVDAKKLNQHLSKITYMNDGVCINKESQRPIKAIVIMHTFGHPVDINPLLATARKFNLKVIEDAAEAVGSLYLGHHVGTFGDIGAFSFNGNKIITTGGGGAVVTNDKALHEKVKHLGTTAKVSGTFEFLHDLVGYNYRMPNVNAAIGLAQLEHLDKKVTQKRALTKLYQSALSHINGGQIFIEPSFAKSNYWLQTLILDNLDKDHRDLLIQKCHKNGLFVRPAWTPLNHLPPFHNCPKMNLAVTEEFAGRIVNLPSSPTIGK